MKELRQENEELRAKNRELEETLDAIRSGEVDAIVVSKGDHQQVYALEGADHPYRVLVENIQEGALTLTATGMILYANAAFAAMRRLPLSRILGSPLRDHIAPRDRAQIDALIETSITGARRGEMSICSGTVCSPVLVSMTPIVVDDDTKISVVVTDRRQDYGRLRLQARMLDSVVDAVTAADPTGTIIYWNEAAERMYGWQASEMIGRQLIEVVNFGMSREDARRIFDRLTAGETWAGEYVVCHRDGHCFPVYTNKTPVYDEEGALIAVIAVSHDISESRKAEESLRVYTQRLKTSNEELQRYAYVASHDLQEPLRGIVSFSQLLSRRYRGRLDETADEYLDFIVEDGQRMQALINDLLQIARVETTGRPFEPTDVAEVIASASRLIEVPLLEAGGTVTVGPMPRVLADPQQLEQVFANLMGNAVKYHRPQVPPAIAISAERHGDWWEFAVTDNGIGIEPEYFDQIFEMFRRLHTKNEYEGTGIGLAVVKRIIERHGGRIRVESTPGKGSRFFFTLLAT